MALLPLIAQKRGSVFISSADSELRNQKHEFLICLLKHILSKIVSKVSRNRLSFVTITN